jgi:hypothetical protein
MYSNNKEYRDALRTFFNMDIEKLKADNKKYNYDEETEDELLFDEVAVNSGMSNILEKTTGNRFFDELYSLAAGLMISTNRETGLCVLLSYDYFVDFYNVWNSYLDNQIDFSETNSYFIILKNRLGKR